MNNKTRGILCVIGLILSTGLTFTLNILAALFSVPLVGKLGVEYSSIAIMWTTMTIGSLTTLTFLGKLYDKVNPKIIFVIGSLAYLLGLSALGLVNSTAAVLVLYFFVGMFNCAISSAALSILGSKWVGVGRGSIIGLGSAVAAVFSVIFSPIAANCINNLGFETTAIASGIILFACSLLISLVFICKPPEAYGAEPIDLKFLAKKKEKSENELELYETKMPISSIMKLPVFWMILLIPFVLCAAQMGFYSNRAGIFELMGMDLMQIATLGAVYTVANSVVVMLFGFLCDKIGFKKPLIIFSLIGVIIYGCWPLLKGGGYAAALFLCFFANVGQINNYIGPNVMLPLFGQNKSSTLISWATLAATIGSIVSPVVIALLPSYDVFFIVAAGLFALSLLFSVVATNKNTLKNIKEVDERYIAEHGLSDCTD